MYCGSWPFIATARNHVTSGEQLCCAIRIKLHTKLSLGRNHTIKFSIQFVWTNNFGALTSRRYFLEEVLAWRNRLFFSAKKLPKLSQVSFLLQKCFRSCYEISFKFAAAIIMLCALAIHCYFSFAKIIRARSQKRNAAVMVVNSYMSSAANCVRRLWNFFRPARKWNRYMENVQNDFACVELFDV